MQHFFFLVDEEHFLVRCSRQTPATAFLLIALAHCARYDSATYAVGMANRMGGAKYVYLYRVLSQVPTLDRSCFISYLARSNLTLMAFVLAFVLPTTRTGPSYVAT